MTSANLSPTHLLPAAWEAFKRRPWIAIATWLVYVFFESGGMGPSDDPGVGGSLLALGLFLLSGPIQGGYDLAMLRLLRDDETLEFTDMFAGLKKFERLFPVFLVFAVSVFVGMLLFVVPGVIIALGFWPAFLLVMEDDLSTFESLSAAWELTRGYKAQLFVLAIVTIVLMLLGIIAFGLGVLIAGPVTQLAWIGAYDEMRAAQSSGFQPGDQAFA